MAADEKRLVLVKPGDVLLIGNVGDVDVEGLAPLGEFFQSLGIRPVLFHGDINMDVVPGGSG